MWRSSLTIVTLLLLGQETRRTQATAFEVASVRQVAGEGGYTSLSPSGSNPFTARNASMTLLLSMAYGVDEKQIEGRPGWADSQLYEIVAKTEGDPGLSYEDLKLPLQQLLISRFGLRVHLQQRNVPGYALVTTTGGIKLRSTTDPPTMGYILNDGLRSQSISMKTFAALLAYPAGRPVVDATGLQGSYALELRFAPEGSTESTLPSVFTALQEQAGLRLQAQAVSIRFLVVDHVDRSPLPN